MRRHSHRFRIGCTQKTHTPPRDGPHRVTQERGETRTSAHTLIALSNRQAGELWSWWMCRSAGRKSPLLRGVINEEDVRRRSSSVRQRCHSGGNRGADMCHLGRSFICIQLQEHEKNPSDYKNKVFFCYNETLSCFKAPENMAVKLSMSP